MEENEWVVVLSTADYDEARLAAGALEAERIEVALPEDPRQYLTMGTAAPMYARDIEVRVAPEDADRARAIIEAQRAATLPPGFADDDVQEWLTERAVRRQKRHQADWKLAILVAGVGALIAVSVYAILTSVV